MGAFLMKQYNSIQIWPGLNNEFNITDQRLYSDPVACKGLVCSNDMYNRRNERHESVNFFTEKQKGKQSKLFLEVQAQAR